MPGIPGLNNYLRLQDYAGTSPTTEWQNEIEKALPTCEALVALLHPEFHNRNWTDQEIGYAMGRGVFVFAVRCGQDPYGFIGRFQAFNLGSKTSLEIATELFDALRKGQQTKNRMSEALVELFVQSGSFAEAKKNIRHLENLTVWRPSFATRLRLALKNNSEVSGAFTVPKRVEQLIRQWSESE